jgi:hypothetical protein
MDEKEKEKLNLFKLSCGFYPYEKEVYNKLKDSGDADPFVLRYMAEDIAFVEETMDRLEEKRNLRAKEIAWCLYVEKKTQEETAERFGITRRQLQYEMELSFKALLEQE